ncbi:hypothetical protein CH92_01300 [Stutzerimonas stutzeri]|uniref:Lipoprotein n=1 Tax=Stutzerimonas stutzeri TaxID=316 RepID=W8QU35_STUST|nr:hypothetical protein [Stutzerimonas stutzeri]AHL73804.1 hypothetical protein CH92_01300 [Stutzerimonas stutzeri]MCQ4328680.1 hypothetical protein [Stutzerimonas stutzeri]
MNRNYLALVSAFVLATTCLQSYADTTVPAQSSAAAANQPCTPSTTGSLLSSARSLLKIAGSVIDTKNSLTDASYAERAQSAAGVSKGEGLLNNVEALGIAGKPCG